MGRKKYYYHSVVGMVLEIAHKGTFHNIFDENIGRRNQLTVFMRVFARHAFTNLCFIRLVAKFIRNEMEEHSEDIDDAKRVLKTRLASLLTSQSSPEESAETRNCKHASGKT